MRSNIAVYREVALGAFVDGLRVVTSGLAAGERIVVNGLQRVRPGALVAPEAVPMNGQTTSQAHADATRPCCADRQTETSWTDQS